MPVSKQNSADVIRLREGLSRRFVHTDRLMMVVIDFSDGPWKEPESMQHHVHEQATYVAAGEIMFFCEGEEPQRLTAGDMFWVPSNRKHGIQLLSADARLVDSFSPVREDFIPRKRMR